jgi:hypothetical protein
VQISIEDVRLVAAPLKLVLAGLQGRQPYAVSYAAAMHAFDKAPTPTRLPQKSVAKTGHASLVAVTSVHGHSVDGLACMQDQPCGVHNYVSAIAKGLVRVSAVTVSAEGL